MILTVVLSLAFSDYVAAQGSSGTPYGTDSRLDARIRITGIVKTKGNMPFAELVLETEGSGDFLLVGAPVDDIAEYHRLQTLTVIGTIIDEGNEIQPPTIEVRCFKEYRQ